MKETLKQKVLAWHPNAYSIEMANGTYAVLESLATLGLGVTPRKAWANAWARLVHASQTKPKELPSPTPPTRAELEEELNELERCAASIRELLAEMINETP